MIRFDDYQIEADSMSINAYKVGEPDCIVKNANLQDVVAPHRPSQKFNNVIPLNGITIALPGRGRRHISAAGRNDG